jgi:hypothetical protein
VYFRSNNECCYTRIFLTWSMRSCCFVGYDFARKCKKSGDTRIATKCKDHTPVQSHISLKGLWCSCTALTPNQEEPLGLSSSNPFELSLSSDAVPVIFPLSWHIEVKLASHVMWEGTAMSNNIMGRSHASYCHIMAIKHTNDKQNK